MSIEKGREWLSDNQRNEVDELERKLRLSKMEGKEKDKTIFTKQHKTMLEAYQRMMTYLGSVNG